MSFTADDVRDLIALLNASHFEEMRLEINGLKLHLKRNGAADGLAPQFENKEEAAPKAPARVSKSVTRVAPPSAPGLIDIPAPTLGVFYAAPKPGAAPFVKVGDRVEETTIIGIIEVMKLMNSVCAGVTGVIAEACVGNGDAVEYGAPLFRVRP
jgi:acetyl-CoA carboxylase biotin carboxyl carrier protein